MSGSLNAVIAQGGNPLGQLGDLVNIARGSTALQQQRFNLQQAQLQPGFMALNSIQNLPELQTQAGWGKISAALAQAKRLGANTDGLVANATEMAAQGMMPADFARIYGMRMANPTAQFESMLPERAIMQTPTGPVPGTWGAAAGGAPAFFTPAQGGAGGGATGPGVSPGAAGTSLGNTASHQDFVAKMLPIAQKVSAQTGLPTDYIIAQAGEETGWGTSRAFANNNFWGISPGGQNVPASYASPEEGAQAYIDLMNSARYRNVPRTGSPGDIATAMASAGYNPDVGGYGRNIQAFANQMGTPPSPTAQPYQVASGGQTWPVPTGAAIQPTSGWDFRPPGGGLQPMSPYIGGGLEQSAKDFYTQRQNYADIGIHTQPLVNAISLLQANPDLKTGPGQDELNQWVAALGAANIPLGNLFNVPQAERYQELAKNLAMNLRGTGIDQSDLDRMQHAASQPGTTMGRNAIITLAAENIGFQRVKVARYLQYQSMRPGGLETPSSAENMPQFFHASTANWMAQQDPTAYAADWMPKDAFDNYWQGLEKAGNVAQFRRFDQSLKDAKRLMGIMPPAAPEQQGGQ